MNETDQIKNGESLNQKPKYLKNQTEEYISFEEKIKIVIPKLTGKDFSKSYPISYTHINNLKEFRNNIIHTETNEGTYKYDHIAKRSFTFKYNETLDSVAHYINFYKKECLVECNCGLDQ